MGITLAGGTLADPARGYVGRDDLHISGDRIGGDGGAEGVSGVVDVSGCLVMPGFVCAHHHLYSALARGMPPPQRAPKNFVEILEKIWWRLDRALDHESIGLSAQLGSLEAVLAGTTTIVDHHASPEAIRDSLDHLADGIDSVGARAVVCYEVTDRHGTERGTEGVEENARFLRSNRRLNVRAMMGAHASFTIGDETMDALVGAARDAGAPIHIHVAEDAADERDSLDRYGERTAHRLARRGALAEGDLIAHGVHLDPSEIDTVRTSGAWVAHNPRSNMNNAVGYAPATSLGERVALGTDGLDGDMLMEARAAFLQSSEHTTDGGVPWAIDRLVAGGQRRGRTLR